MLKRLAILSIAASLGALLALPAGAAPSYSVTALAAIDDAESMLTGINQQGKIAGTTFGLMSIPTATVWTGGASAPANNEFISWSARINNAGTVAGNTLGFSGDYTYNSAIVGTQKMYAGAGIESSAYALNNHGVAVGYAKANATLGEAKLDMGNANHATVWNGTTATDIHPGGAGNSYARAINDAGQIAGEVNGVVTRWDNGTVSYLQGGKVAAINQHGAIAGTDNFGSVVVWDSLGAHNLGGGTASDINNLGQVVGSSNGRATLWSNGQVYDLNSFLSTALLGAGWLLTDAVGINDAGMIAANGYNALLDVSQGYRLSPLSSLAPVPEAQTWAMLLAGLCLIGVARRRRA